MIVTATQDAIDRAAEILRAGGLVAFPTETVYGLGADATGDAAVARIFEAKGRPRFNPLICHCADAGAVRRLVTWTGDAARLADMFWPGALTLVLPRRPDSPVSFLASAGLDTIAVRVPDHPIAQALLNAVGRPIAAPSANRSGAVSPTTARHVSESLGDRVELILDGGACPGGLESTVVDVSGAAPAVLRPGLIPRAAIEAVVGPLAAAGEAVTAPGMLASHYAPGAPLRLNAKSVEPGEALLAFGPAGIDGGKQCLNLSESGDLREAAANLFAMLRALDSPEVSAIAVMPVPDDGLGEAINDRLRRAAAPRS